MKTKIEFGDIGWRAEEALFYAQVILDTKKKCRVLRLYPTTPECEFPQEFRDDLNELSNRDKNIKWCYAQISLEGMMLKGSLLAIIREEN